MRRFAIATLWILASTLFWSMGYSESAMPTFSVSIQPVQTSAPAGAPVKVTVELKNISNQPIPIGITSRGGGLEYLIRDSAGQIRAETSHGLWVHGKDPAHPSMGTVFSAQLSPGQSLPAGIDDLSQLYDLTMPDTYTIQAVRWDPIAKIKVMSNTITIMVTR
jgi:hypothetical protein